MRPTKEALVRKVCTNMDLLEYKVDDVLTDDALQQITNDGSDKVIFSITQANQVSSKLFLTSHQFTNVVGTDIYIYIGNNQGQTAYQMLLEEMSKVRRLDEKLVTFLRDECNDSLTEINLKEDIPEKIPEKVDEIVEQTPNHLIFSNVAETLLNKGIGQILLDNQFDVIGDSHIFIYNGNTAGSQMINRLNQESFIILE
ncbi:MAG: hypothetical protein UC390_00040 [Peptococcaceae bacterium]|nr:hypothetical protein [Peptococcaceae bacterium]